MPTLDDEVKSFYWGRVVYMNKGVLNERDFKRGKNRRGCKIELGRYESVLRAIG